LARKKEEYLRAVDSLERGAVFVRAILLQKFSYNSIA